MLMQMLQAHIWIFPVVIFAGLFLTPCFGRITKLRKSKVKAFSKNLHASSCFSFWTIFQFSYLGRLCIHIYSHYALTASKTKKIIIQTFTIIYPYRKLTRSYLMTWSFWNLDVGSCANMMRPIQNLHWCRNPSSASGSLP